MKIRVSTEIISKLDPCEKGFANWNKHYPEFDDDITEFLRLENIPHLDKVWLATRLMPNHLCAIFAMDCALSAYIHYINEFQECYQGDFNANLASDYASSALCGIDTKNAADATAYNALAYYGTRKLEETSQVEALIYLIGGKS